MSELKVTGKIEKFLDVESGISKAGKDWQKQSYLLRTTDEYFNLYCLDVFGAEKVEQLTKFNKVGDDVCVSFNVGCNEWNDKYFTSLNSWRIEKLDSNALTPPTFAEVGEALNDVVPDDLPF
jgi:hypothetical protein